MSTKPETTFIASVHRLLPSALYRMKNHNVYNAGVPDVWYSGPQDDLWVEYKFIELPARDDTLIPLAHGTRPMLSALQQQWLRTRYEEGRKVGVMVGCKGGGVWFPGVNWDCEVSAGDFRSWVTPRHKLAALIQHHTGPEP